MVSIAVDCMGGDDAPQAVIEGVCEGLSAAGGDGLKLLLVGDEEILASELASRGVSTGANLEVVHAPDVIGMGDPPAAAIRAKRHSSINVAVDLVKKGCADAVFSAGNTGATVASTVLKLRTLPGVERPGIATVFPSPSGHFVLIDAGATVDCKPVHLVHYAVMGDAYERNILGKSEPRIGLLNVGGEHGKGNDLCKETYTLLSGLPELNFIGNVEGHDLFADHVDVVVCDGFVGNVVLKTCESLARAIAAMLEHNLRKNALRGLGYCLSRGAYNELRRTCDDAEFGGAPLLGVNGVSIIGHGSSSPKAVRNALRVASDFVLNKVNRHIVERIEHLGLAPAAVAAVH